jgi:GxxExxY protein
MQRDNRDPETHAIIVAAMAVEFGVREIRFEKEVALSVWYKGHRLSATYRADFVCYGSIIVEIKALSASGTPEEAQVLNYRKASGYERGLLLNFGAPSLQHGRLVFSKNNLRKSAKSADERRMSRHSTCAAVS